MNTLSAKFALLLAAAFFAASLLLLWLARMDVAADRLPGLMAQVAIGAVAFALLAALAAFQLVGRRLRRLTDALEQYRRDGCKAPLRLPGADAQGDEIERLAAHVQQMSAHIAEQLRALEQQAAQRHELLANVSHDLRTPLASMQGYLEMLLLRQHQLEPTEARNYLETAARHSERLGRLVGDLFDLTKLDDGALQPQYEDFVPAELAHDVAQKFAHDAQRRQVKLHADCSAAPGLRACADVGLIERVLENLVENALQHTPAGGTVTLQLGRDARRARLAVEDTGCGIAADTLRDLFDRYERADRRGGGRVGLRLAISQRIVRLHGGELQVHSTPGAGSRFSFDLPLAGTLAAAPADRTDLAA